MSREEAAVELTKFVSDGGDEYEDDELDKQPASTIAETRRDVIESDSELDVQRPLLSSNSPPPAAAAAADAPVVRKQFRFADSRVGVEDAEPGEADNLLAANRSDTRVTETDEEGFAETNLDETTTGLRDADASGGGPGERSHINLIDNIQSQLPQIQKLIFVATLAIVILLALLIVIPNCLIRIEYDELALTRNAWTGSVRYDRVYGPGMHFVLPWYETILFDKSAQLYKLDELNIFTTNKLSVKTSWIIYYFLDEKKLGELYRNFANEFRPVIESVSKSVLLNHGSEFSIDDYRTKRAQIRTYLRSRLKQKLESEYGLRVLDVYVGRITFTKEINRLNLLRMLNGIYNEKALYDKQTNVTRAETQFRINKLRNEARFTLESAQARAINQVQKVEETKRYEKLELTHLVGLNNTLRQLKFYDSPRQSDTMKKSAMSFCYLSSLINNENVRFVQRSEDKNAMLGYYIHDDDDGQTSDDVDDENASSINFDVSTNTVSAGITKTKLL